MPVITAWINNYRSDNGRAPVSISVIEKFCQTQDFIKRSRRTTTTTGKKDPNSTWAMARLEQFKQFLQQLEDGKCVEDAMPLSASELASTVDLDATSSALVAAMGRAKALENMDGKMTIPNASYYIVKGVQSNAETYWKGNRNTECSAEFCNPVDASGASLQQCERCNLVFHHACLSPYLPRAPQGLLLQH